MIDQDLAQLRNARLLHEILGVLGIRAPQGREPPRRCSLERPDRPRISEPCLQKPSIVVHDRPPATVEVRLGHDQDHGLYPRGCSAEEFELTGTELGASFDHEEQGIGKGQGLQGQLGMTRIEAADAGRVDEKEVLEQVAWTPICTARMFSAFCGLPLNRRKTLRVLQ